MMLRPSDGGGIQQHLDEAEAALLAAGRLAYLRLIQQLIAAEGVRCMQ